MNASKTMRTNYNKRLSTTELPLTRKKELSCSWLLHFFHEVQKKILRAFMSHFFHFRVICLLFASHI